MMRIVRPLITAFSVVGAYGLIGVVLLGGCGESQAQRQANRVRAMKLAQRLLVEARAPVTGELGGRLYRLEAQRNVAAMYARPQRSGGGYGGLLGSVYRHAHDAGAMATAMAARRDLQRIDKEIAKIHAIHQAQRLEFVRSKLTPDQRRFIKRYHPEFLDPSLSFDDLISLQNAVLSNAPTTQPSGVSR